MTRSSKRCYRRAINFTQSQQQPNLVAIQLEVVVEHLAEVEVALTSEAEEEASQPFAEAACSGANQEVGHPSP